VIIGFLLGMIRGILYVVIGSQTGIYVFNLTAIVCITIQKTIL